MPSSWSTDWVHHPCSPHHKESAEGCPYRKVEGQQYQNDCWILHTGRHLEHTTPPFRCRYRPSVSHARRTDTGPFFQGCPWTGQHARCYPAGSAHSSRDEVKPIHTLAKGHDLRNTERLGHLTSLPKARTPRSQALVLVDGLDGVRVDHCAVGDCMPVSQASVIQSVDRRRDKLNHRFVVPHTDPYMPGAGVDRAGRIAVVRSSSRVAAWVAGLRHTLVHNSVALIANEQVIVPVKDRRHLVLDKQVVNRAGPPWAMFGESG